MISPLPWSHKPDQYILDANGRMLSDYYTENGNEELTNEEQDFIVKAVNNHDALVSVLEDILNRLYGCSMEDFTDIVELGTLRDRGEKLIKEIKNEL